jgi:hypothetical protein
VDKIDLAEVLYEVSARLAGAQALLEACDDYDSREELLRVNRLLRDADSRAIAAAAALVLGDGAQ